MIAFRLPLQQEEDEAAEWREAEEAAWREWSEAEWREWSAFVPQYEARCAEKREQLGSPSHHTNENRQGHVFRRCEDLESILYIMNIMYDI